MGIGAAGCEGRRRTQGVVRSESSLSWTVFGASLPLRRGVRGAGHPPSSVLRWLLCQTDNDMKANSSRVALVVLPPSMAFPFPPYSC